MTRTRAASLRREQFDVRVARSFVYGEGTYSEVLGNLTDARLPAQQLELAQGLRAVADARGVPLVGVFVGGRDRVLGDFDALFDAHAIAFYPGAHGAAALVDMLLGAACPSGRLPLTLHRGDVATLPYWRGFAEDAAAPASLHDMSPPRQVAPLYAFGHGLSYTTFTFSDFRLTNTNVAHLCSTPDHVASPPPGFDAALAIDAGDVVEVALSVTNTGERAGAWPILLFVGDDACVAPPPPPMLKAFTKPHLAPGERTTVRFEVRVACGDDNGDARPSTQICLWAARACMPPAVLLPGHGIAGLGAAPPEACPLAPPTCTASVHAPAAGDLHEQHTPGRQIF